MKVGHESSYNEYSEAMRQKNIEDKIVENDMEDALNGVEPGGFSDRIWTLDNRRIYKATPEFNAEFEEEL